MVYLLEVEEAEPCAAWSGSLSPVPSPAGRGEGEASPPCPLPCREGEPQREGLRGRGFLGWGFPPPCRGGG